jgi:hypothetical protein
MPKVKQESINFEGTTFVSVYSVDGRGLFTVQLPESVRQILNYSCITAATLEACQQEFKNTLQKYYEAQTTTKRVILYEILATAYVWDDQKERCLYNEKDISFCEGCAVSVAAQVFDERAIQSSKGSIHYRYDKVEDCKLNKRAVTYAARFDTWPRTRPEKRLDYTPEREEFFIKISRGLEAVILQLDQLNNTETALQCIDSGILSLTAGNDL